MKLVTRFELVAKDENELRGLLRKVINELARSDPRSYERRNALASIENIQSELNFYTLPRGMNVVHTHLAVVLSTIILETAVGVRNSAQALAAPIKF